MASIQTLLTVEDLDKLPEHGRWYELVDGVAIKVSPSSGVHGMVMAAVTEALRVYNRAHNLGVVLAGDPGIVSQRGPDTVRGPDVCFFARERLSAAGIPPTGYLEVVPDFVVEIVSPGDSAIDVQEKLEPWLAAGVRLVWTMYPKRRSIAAHQSLAVSRIYTATETIDGAPVLPDFRIIVGDLFE